jgi:hypothetical protein
MIPHLIRSVIWSLCIGFSIIVFAHGSSNIPAQSTAIQQAAIAAETCMYLIFLFVLARAIDGITRS